jgi:putative endonuclease
MRKHHQYFVYIVTNKYKTVLYTGVTNNLLRRKDQHQKNAQSGDTRTFTGKYNVYHLVYFEEHKYVLNAIAREKEIKDWKREDKINLIEAFNPNWKFYFEEDEV